MSQAKVDRRKEYKKNRKQILKREKTERAISKAIACVVAVVIIGGVGFSVYKKANPEPEQTASTFYGLVQTDSYGILDPTLSE